MTVVLQPIHPCACMQSTYTGVYAQGGPTNVDGKGDLSELCDRSDANVRGVTQKYASSH